MLSQLQLVKLTKKLKKNKIKIVFTNGCFDILHRGHVTYLDKAKRLGDVLIVALNSDSSVKKLKGPTRPIHTLKDRQFIIAALECVDYVSFFSDSTPINLIKKITPDILIKGGDWKPKDIVGSDWVLKNGGIVKSIPFVAGHSTTKILNKSNDTHRK